MTTTDTIAPQNRYFPIDCTKITLAMMIIARHSLPLTDNATANVASFAIANIAVPLFFLFSGFFFEKKRNFKSFAKRILTLYLFWLIISWPLCFISYRGLSITQAIQQTLFSNSYGGSWFLISLVWCAAITTAAFKIKSNKIAWGGGLIALSSVLYILYTADCSYCNITSGTFIHTVTDAYKHAFHTLRLSFAEGLIYFVTGFAISATARRPSFVAAFVATLIAAALYATENYLIVHYRCGDVTASSCLTMPLLVTAIACLTLSLCRPTKFVNEGRLMRQASTFVYMLHQLVMLLLGVAAGIYNGTPRLLLTALICCATFYIYCRLRKHRSLRWLKYAC